MMSANPAFPNIQPVEQKESVEKTWNQPLIPAGCPHCKQAYLVLEARLGQACPNCWQGALTPQPALLRNEPPELLIPFEKTLSDLDPILRRFVQGVWLHGDDFTPEAILRRAVPVYWPMWLVDSDVSGEWQAEVGFDYQVKSSRESYHGSGWQSQDVVETRIRWEPRLGDLQRHYDNIAIPALTEHNDLTRRLGNYRLNQAPAYDPARLGKADVHVPDQQPENAWPLAQSSLNQAASAECLKAAGAQHIRNHNIRANYQSLHWTQLLLPMYVSYYTDDDGHPHTVYINAQTGMAGGERLASQRKGWLYAGISAGIAALLFFLGMVSIAMVPLLPALSAFGIPLVMLAFLFLIIAIFPAAWPWQWNRSQMEQKVHQKG